MAPSVQPLSTDHQRWSRDLGVLPPRMEAAQNRHDIRGSPYWLLESHLPYPDRTKGTGLHLKGIILAGTYTTNYTAASGCAQSSNSL